MRRARPAHNQEKGCKTVCRHRHSLHDHHRFLLPSHLGEPKPAVVTVLGLWTNLSDPTARRHLDRTEAEDREYNAMFHIQALSFSVNYLSNAPSYPSYLMISSPPDDSLKPSRRNLHECNRCFSTSQETHGFASTEPDCVSHTLLLPLSGVRLHAMPSQISHFAGLLTAYGFTVVRHH